MRVSLFLEIVSVACTCAVAVDGYLFPRETAVAVDETAATAVFVDVDAPPAKVAEEDPRAPRTDTGLPSWIPLDWEARMRASEVLDSTVYVKQVRQVGDYEISGHKWKLKGQTRWSDGPPPQVVADEFDYLAIYLRVANAHTYYVPARLSAAKGFFTYAELRDACARHPEEFVAVRRAEAEDLPRWILLRAVREDQPEVRRWAQSVLQHARQGQG